MLPTRALPAAVIAPTSVGVIAGGIGGAGGITGAGGGVGAGAGAGGAVGITAVEVSESADVPVMFIATDLNVYETPLVKPVTTQEPLAPLTVQVLSTPETCGDAVTINEVGVPPVVAAVTETVACALPATAVGTAGLSGIVITVEPFVTVRAVNVAASFPAKS